MKQPEHIYLDYAAATPVDLAVLAAMQPYFTDKFHNASATYLTAKAVTKDIEVARSTVAHWLGARSNEVIFTAGGTEANNMAIHGVMANYPDGNMVVSAIEHPAVIDPARRYEHKIAPVTAEGIIDLEALEQLIDDRTVLVSVMYANNEIGTIQPLRHVAEIISKKRDERTRRRTSDVVHRKSAIELRASNVLPLYFHTDACQAAAYLDLHVSRLGVNLMTINAGKIYGPKQCGALYAKAGLELQPLITGGGQERGRRSGTESAANIVGLATALDLAQGRRADESRRLQSVQQLFFELIDKQLPQATINGSRKHRLPNNVHVTIPGINNERLIMELDERGIQCAAGSACSAAKQDASTVLAAIGLDETSARASLRFTMGRDTTEKHIQQTISTLADLV